VKHLSRSLIAASLILMPSTAALAASPAESTWEAVDKVFGQSGKDLPGGVHRHSWPRTDLTVKIGTVRVAPSLALGSWAGFLQTGNDGHVMTMGDLMLLAGEANPVIRALQAGGVDVIALHNHILGETPQIMALHFEGHGRAEALAKALAAALEKTATPRSHSSGSPTPASPAESAAFDKIQEVLGRKGAVSDHVLQIGVARAAKIEEGAIEIPPSFGMANPMNFQMAGDKVATTGDFVLVADEVNPVIHELESHGIEVTALHSHMLRETPRLFFMHFWGVDDPERIAEGLKAALGKVAVK
jgi:uncharacterized protein DUF1259